ncbi:MAG: hypothetical protein IH984_10320 [Planctomycetes bacterium]|nr:hypothetical protein [Planctomycetota bacterium]
MKLLIIIALCLMLMGCEQEPEVHQLSEDFVENPTDEDLEFLVELAERGEANLSPREITATKVEAFLSAYNSMLEQGKGDEFVARVKSKAARAGTQAEARADVYLDAAYDTYDAAYPNKQAESYSTQELIKILMVALGNAILDGDEGAISVIQGSLIHVYSAAHNA